MTHKKVRNYWTLIPLFPPLNWRKNRLRRGLCPVDTTFAFSTAEYSPPVFCLLDQILPTLGSANFIFEPYLSLLLTYFSREGEVKVLCSEIHCLQLNVAERCLWNQKVSRKQHLILSLFILLTWPEEICK